MERRYYIHIPSGVVYGHAERYVRDARFRRMSADEVDEYLTFIRLPKKRPVVSNEALTHGVDGDQGNA